jgi:uncharacterized membrane protein
MTNITRSLVLAFLLTSTLAFAQGTYTQIDYPGSTETVVYGINSAGEIVGAYVSGVNWHGFLLSGGVYTEIGYDDGPNYLTSINDVGQIVGSASDTDLGFVYDRATQMFTTFGVPRANAQTLPYAINNAGTIAGYYNTKSEYGFELIGSQFREVSPSGDNTSWATGISTSGKIVGHGCCNGLANFEYDHGKYTAVTIPNAPSAVLEGINPAGTALVGIYFPSSSKTFGFIYENHTLTTLMFPGTKWKTYPLGINSAGEVVGYITDLNGNEVHGFTWTPPAPTHNESRP